MINLIHSLIHRPDRGWDPVPPEHAQQYSSGEWASGVRPELLDELASWVGGLDGRSVLDLGGGPGQYAVAFAQRGARVTWFDVSETYRALASEKATSAGVDIRFKVGYLDDAPRLLGEKFDLVFNRICWNYSRGDRAFSRIIFSLAKPGGVVYIDTTHSKWRREQLSISARLRTAINDLTWLKLGHPFPPHGRLAKLFATKAVRKLTIDYSSPHNDRITFTRAEQAE